MTKKPTMAKELPDEVRKEIERVADAGHIWREPMEEIALLAYRSGALAGVRVPAALLELSKNATGGEWEDSRGFVRAQLPTSGFLGGTDIQFGTSCTWVAETVEGEGYVPGNCNAAFIAALVNWFRSLPEQPLVDQVCGEGK